MYRIAKFVRNLRESEDFVEAVAILKAVINAPARAGDVNSSFKFQLVKLELKLFCATEN